MSMQGVAHRRLVWASRVARRSKEPSLLEVAWRAFAVRGITQGGVYEAAARPGQSPYVVDPRLQ